MDKIIIAEKDPDFKNDIASQPGAESFMRCFTCGTCTASCPVAEVNDQYDPRKIIRMSILGMRKEVLSSDILWMCSRCYTCHALCPQNVKFTDVISILRDMAVKEGYVPAERLEKARELDRIIQDLRCRIIGNKLHPDEELGKEILRMVQDEIVEEW
ncbi:MAG: 4Fe-4S dicluster domain-containing protein [Candidatus Fermentibacteraceae bacterium]|nr:4Fe-4S dicluster domain-containing protein [Candidatus Fermentibacteraceae bacterium]MBN2608546.1 4Fe-4S dicluster domain-containing protein [Candidatus Fermentibacteraceae bacterium]